ncbi:MAG: T9SS C-terminal target domain-containing protein [Bacteroidetes bacterium]|nr:MAG: T9SS C-terminal target domain-containing protein [Bacteroidota bacterium]
MVHITHNNGPENSSDAQVIAGIEQLNDAFANINYYDQGSGVDIEIEFCLAKQDPDGNATNGITRHVSTLTNLNGSTQDLTLKNLSRWDPTCYLNIWVVKSIYLSYSGIFAAGYAYYPSAHGLSYDGIVIRSSAIGQSEAKTTTLAHEVGHYLGLYHTFEGGCINNNCFLDGDRVCDTPPDQSTSYVPCDLEVNTCGTDTNSGLNADLPDDTHNYMDYQFKECRHDFTEGQKERMIFFLTQVRSSLLDCTSCLDPCPFTMNLTISSEDTLYVPIGQNYSLSPEYTQNLNGIDWYIDGEWVNNGLTFEHQFTEAGVFQLSGLGHNTLANCASKFDAVMVKTYCAAPPVIDILPDTVHVTLGQDTQIPTIGQNIHEAVWTIYGEIAGNGLDHIFNFTEYGQFFLNLTTYNEYEACYSSDRVLIIVNCPIDATFEVSQSTALIGDTITFSANNLDALSYQWYINSEPSGNDPTIEIGFANSGTYSIVLVVEEEFCERTSNHFYLVVEDPCTYGNKVQQIRSWEISAPVWMEMDEDGNYLILDHGHGIYVVNQNFEQIWAMDNSIEGFEWGSATWQHAVVDTINGGFILVGYFVPHNGYVVMKISATGAFEWSKLIHIESANTLHLGEVRIKQVSNGNFVIVGNTADNLGTYNSVFISFITEIDPLGNQIWLQGYYGINLDDFEQTNEGGYLITGWTNLDYALTLLKVDSVGEYIWAKRFYLGANNWVGSYRKILPTYDNGFMLGFTSGAYNIAPYQTRIGKINEFGEIIFLKSFVDSDAPEESCYMNGFSKALNGDILFSIGQLENAIHARMTNDGEIVWAQKFFGDDHFEIIRNFTPGLIITAAYPGFFSFHNEDGEQEGCEVEPANYIFEDISYSTGTPTFYYINNYFLYDDYSGITIESLEIELDTLCISEGLSAFDASLELTGLQTCGDSLLLRYNICNLGNQPIPSQTPMTLYHRDPTREITTGFFTAPVGNTVEPEDCKELFMIVPYPEGMNIYAMLNDDGSLAPIFDIVNDFPVTEDYECNFFNNIASISLDELIDLPPLDWDPIDDAILCPSDTLSLVASEGFDNYLWQDGSTGQSFIANGPGIYTIAASTICGEFWTDTIFINPPEIPELDLGPDLESCQSQVVTVNAQSGFDTYIWHDGSNLPGYTATDPGTYWVTTTDECGAIQTDTIEITHKPGFSFELGENLTICPGDSILVNIEANYSAYQWYPNHGVQCITCPETVLKPDTTTQYLLTASDDSGCISSDTLTLTVLPAYFVEEEISICDGESIELFGNQEFEAGTYSQNYTSAVGCDSTVQVTLNVLPNFETQELMTICEGEEVLIFGEIHSQDGLFSESYLASNGCDSTHFVQLNVLPPVHTFENISPCTGEVINVFGEEVSQSGTFSVTFSGINNCDSIHTITVEFVDEIFTNQSITICQGETVDIFGEATFEQGNYAAIFQSQAGCDSTHQVELIVLDTISTESFHTICDGETLELFGESFSDSGTYMAAFEAINGCDSFHYAHLDVLPIASSFQNLSICHGEEIEIFGQMEHLAGEYIQVLEAANGCDSIVTIDLEVHDSLVIDQHIINTCPEIHSGNIWLTPVVASGPVEYTWSHSNENINGFAGLPEGIYSVTVTDQNQCSADIEIELTTIPFPDYSITTDPVSCFDSNDGQIHLSSNDQGLLTSLNDEPFLNNYTYQNLSSGNHQLIIQQADGCELQETVFIESPVAISVESLQIISPTCANLSDGSIQVNAIGGVGNLNYNWNDEVTSPLLENLYPDNYHLTISDENNCQLDTTIILEAISAISPNVHISYGCGDGHILVSSFPDGGIPPYELAWSNNQSGNYLVNLSSGEYALSVTDAQGCELTEFISVQYVAPLTLNYNVQDVSCQGGNDGMIDLLVSGGTPPYDFVWNTGETSEDLEDLSSGFYQVNLFSGDCSVSENIYINQPDLLAVNIELVQTSGNIFDATSQVSGGTPPFEIEWSNGTSGNSTTNLYEGTEYSVTITDAHNCSITEWFTATITANENTIPDNELEVYPIPSSGILYYELNENSPVLPYDLRISNLEGKTILMIHNLTSGEGELDLTNIPAGVYFLSVKNQQKHYLRKILIID